MTQSWHDDVLGAGFQQLTLQLQPEAEGVGAAPVATLVRHLPQPHRWWRRRPPLHDVDVLYVHGWSDYFFQTTLARFWAERGARFFALDLRRYGRSLREGDEHGYITDLNAYDEEIGLATAAMQESAKEPRRLVLMGHSTGGLVLSLWAHRNPGAATAIVLNSPWLEFQFGARTRAALAGIAELRTKFDPHAMTPKVDYGFYSRAQQLVFDEEDPYEYDQQWRPLQAPPAQLAWLNAVLDGHTHVDHGLSIDAPICVLLSARSIAPVKWSEELTEVDSVLSVDRVAKAALKLGSSVTIERIDGALHDVFLSRREARREAYARLDHWALGMLGQRR